MVRRSLVAMAACSTLFAGALTSQATFTPAFNAPSRAFTQSEFGASLSIMRGRQTGLELQYRIAMQALDIGLRGGMVLRDGPLDELFIIGAEGRYRVIAHTEQFPLDGGVILGVGLNFGGGTVVNIPMGFSLGRRLDIKDSPVSIVPYVQPTGFIRSGGGSTEFTFGLGFGGDFRLSRVFDARISVGVADGPEGVSISAVWLH